MSGDNVVILNDWKKKREKEQEQALKKEEEMLLEEIEYYSSLLEDMIEDFNPEFATLHFKDCLTDPRYIDSLLDALDASFWSMVDDNDDDTI